MAINSTTVLMATIVQRYVHLSIKVLPRQNKRVTSRRFVERKLMLKNLHIHQILFQNKGQSSGRRQYRLPTISH